MTGFKSFRQVLSFVKPLTVLRDATGVSSPNHNKKDQMNVKVVC